MTSRSISVPRKPGSTKRPARGAEWVALPEMFAYLRREGQDFPFAQPIDGSILGEVRAWARAHGIWILAGTIAEASGDERVYNTSVLVDPAGDTAAVYRKIHLFDVDLADQGGQAYRESKSIAPGDALAVAGDPVRRRGALGLLRPALPRALPRADEAGGCPLPHRPERVSRRRRAATIGRCCCGRARSRTSAS